MTRQARSRLGGQVPKGILRRVSEIAGRELCLTGVLYGPNDALTTIGFDWLDLQELVMAVAIEFDVIMEPPDDVSLSQLAKLVASAIKAQ